MPNTNIPKRTYLDLLPVEILDMIFLYTDIDAMICFDRDYCIRKFLSIKKNKKKFNWVEAAQKGKIHWMKYMLTRGITTTHSGELLYHALLNGQIECAQWIWDHGKRIRMLLYPKKHQRNYNQLASTDALRNLLRQNKKKEALWLLKNTTVPYCLNAMWDLCGIEDINADIAAEMIWRQRFAKPDGSHLNQYGYIVKKWTGTETELKLRIEILDHLVAGDFPSWWFQRFATGTLSPLR